MAKNLPLKKSPVNCDVRPMKPTTFTLQLNNSGIAKTGDFPKLSKYGIYFIRSGKRVIRIGECASGNSRLKKGFREPLRKVLRGKERTNYIAYSWRTKYKNSKLSVDYFSLDDEKLHEAKLRRALEAEVTFQFRISKKSWPIEMSEIHFLEKCRKNRLVVNTMKKLLEHYGCKYNAMV